MTAPEISVECPDCHRLIFTPHLAPQKRIAEANERAAVAEIARQQAEDKRSEEQMRRGSSDAHAAKCDQALAAADHLRAIAESEVSALRLGNDALTVRLRIALDVLRTWEWGLDWNGVPSCLICRGHSQAVHLPDYDREAGHAPDCALTVALGGKP